MFFRPLKSFADISRPFHLTMSIITSIALHMVGNQLCNLPCYNRRLADSQVMQEHVGLVFEPIICFWSHEYPSEDLSLSGSLGERLFLPDIIGVKTGSHLISVGIDMLRSRPGKKFEVHLNSRDCNDMEFYIDPTDCSTGFLRIARVA